MPRAEYREPKKFEIKGNFLYIDGEKVCSVDRFEVIGDEELDLILHIKLNDKYFFVGGELP